MNFSTKVGTVFYILPSFTTQESRIQILKSSQSSACSKERKFSEIFDIHGKQREAKLFIFVEEKNL